MPHHCGHLRRSGGSGGARETRDRRREGQADLRRHTQKRVETLLGPPLSHNKDSWTYHDPPHRPDGPYTWYTFTFTDGKVSQIDSGGVSCVYRSELK
jgi:hypothetical protein